jgi:hypothetical protein
MSLTKRELKCLKRKFAEMAGGGESFPNSGNFLGQLGEPLKFPDPSIMHYVVLHHSSSVPLSKKDFQKIILDAKIFFMKQDIEQFDSSIEFYRKKYELEPETEFYSNFLKDLQKQNAAAAMLLAKLQSEAKAAADAADASEASEAFEASEASRSADAAEAAVSAESAESARSN